MSNFRPTVYAAIDSERTYQDLRWGRTASSGLPGNGGRTLDEFCGYITGYALELLGIAAHSDVGVNKLEHIRKIAGMCVAAMEQHGAPFRTLPGTPGEPVFANPVDALASRRSDAQAKSLSGACQKCNWTNTSLLNVGVHGSPFWMCHGCLARMAQQFLSERILTTEFTSPDPRSVNDQAKNDPGPRGNVGHECCCEGKQEHDEIMREITHS